MSDEPKRVHLRYHYGGGRYRRSGVTCGSTAKGEPAAPKGLWTAIRDDLRCPDCDRHWENGTHVGRDGKTRQL